MDKQKKLDLVYMAIAENMASLSYGVRAKVGAVAVTANGVLITGVNGLPRQLGNNLEYRSLNIISTFGSPAIIEEGNLITKNTVIHAENNILVKCAREGVSMLGSTVYITLAPCAHCASMLVSAGVTRVVYKDDYKTKEGLETLTACSVEVVKL